MSTRLSAGMPLFFSFALAVVACGGGAAPPPGPPAPSGKPETFAEVHPDDLAALGGAADAGAAEASASAPAADAGAAPASSGPVATKSTEPPDECTPLGVEWEKTARPKLKECYAEGKKKDPNLQGTVRISVDIDIRGKIKSQKIVEKTLPDPVAQCMLKAVKATPIPDQDKCRGKSLTIPVTFPTPK
ncbi:MAG: energy transducer TonB [Deltaproteobacteria bacterium]|nr:energy transducer TonB [Deltaproteobacteria bacterium]